MSPPPKKKKVQNFNLLCALTPLVQMFYTETLTSFTVTMTLFSPTTSPAQSISVQTLSTRCSGKTPALNNHRDERRLLCATGMVHLTQQAKLATHLPHKNHDLQQPQPWTGSALCQPQWTVHLHTESITSHMMASTQIIKTNSYHSGNANRELRPYLDSPTEEIFFP